MSRRQNELEPFGGRADPAVSLGGVVVALVGRSVRFPWTTVLLSLLVTAAALWLLVTRFALDSNVTRLFPQDLPWRLAERQMEQAFPQRQDLILVVLDRTTPSEADRDAEALAEALRARPQLFRTVRRPDAGAFWRQHGLLFLETGEVRAVTERLVEAQPWLGTVAADPSLRGFAGLLRLMGEGMQRGETPPERVRPILEATEAAARAALEGRVAPPDWQGLMTGRAPAPLELRRLILVQPALDYGQLSSGADATAVIRGEAARLGIGPIRLTGPVPMADEEFATVADGAVESTVVSFVLVGLLLWKALRSFRLIWPLLTLVVLGLIWTGGFGILAVGRFNPLSIAFAVLFIGIGVDFGIQYAVQYRAERARAGGTSDALRAAARTAGPGMTLAALAVASSFFAFMPTDYKGVAELGLIAGVGMLIGWWLAMTLLPALILLARPRDEAREVGYPMLGPVDEFLSRYARAVAVLGGIVALGCIIALSQLRFDTNPINLRDPGAESVATWRDLARDKDTNPNTLDVLTPGPEAAAALAARLGALREVARTTTLTDFVPADQEAKLALIEDAAMLLGPTLVPGTEAPPTDAQSAAALRRAGVALGGSVGEALRALAAGTEAQRATFAQAILPGLADILGKVRDMLAAKPVTLESLPEDLRADWLTADGRARVEVAPASLPGDETEQLRRFARAVQTVAPGAVGLATSSLESSATIEWAFVQSGILAVVLVMVLLWLALRSVRLSLLAVAPLALAGLLTLAHCALLGPDLNLANIIALPLLFGQGVAYDIYFVAAWKQGRRDLLASPLNRAVIYSAITNAAAFGALALSPHPGTASMGVVLSMSLVYSLLCVMLVLPPLLKLFASRS
ncbi:MMPL family transporter [Sabulicella rubraurantiaca]|uniref:MMPL family transporter n=1 Tax=Sabulicella rubraurantiaca TaxID=2811429 RepID=UPI001A9655D9|nr:MMPL family transporter [Sabulicella rubraurantiaca]